MDKKKLENAKMHATFGTMAFITGVALIFMGQNLMQNLMGISSSIVGTLLAIKGFKTIKEEKNK